MAAVTPRPRSARPGLALRSRGVVAAGVIALLALVAILGVAPTPASARRAQDPTSTFPVDGSSTTLPGASTTVAPSASTAVPEAEGEGADLDAGGGRVADENRKIWAVVAGLVLVALALSALTVRYWRKTRPVPPPTTGLMLPTDAALAVALAADPGPATAETPEATGPAPVAGLPADAAEGTADQPVGEDEAQRPDDEVSPWAPAAVAADTDHGLLDTGDDTAPVPVVEAPAAEPTSARRAVAGADHAAADDAWEPRGTGEHERVVVPPASRAIRPTPEQRAALFARRARPDS